MIDIQSSRRLTSIARAEGFVLVPEHTTLPAGSWQEVSISPWR